MTNNDFPSNLVVKCNKEEAYKFIEWCKSNDLNFLGGSDNTPDNPWNFNVYNKKYIGYNLQGFITFSKISYYESETNYEIISFKEFMIRYKQIYFKTKDQEYNKKVIKYLESIGGVNNTLSGKTCNAIYYINEDNIIKCAYYKNSFSNYLELKLEDVMETKEIHIEIPEGYCIDEENSSFTCIKFKPKKLTYEDVAKKLFKGARPYFFGTDGEIHEYYETCNNYVVPNLCSSKKQAEKIIALNKLINVAKYFNGDWKPDFDCDNSNFSFELNFGKALVISSYSTLNCGIPCFKTRELAEQAIDILGEETIKLALSTDF